MKQLEGGKKLLRVVLSTMKNHQATYEKLDRSLLDKIIVQCEDARYGHFIKSIFFRVFPCFFPGFVPLRHLRIK